MNTSGFNSENEMMLAQFKPLIDARNIDKYRRKSCLSWTLFVPAIVLIALVVALWMK